MVQSLHTIEILKRQQLKCWKRRNEISPEIIRDIFTKRINNHYYLGHINYFETPFVTTVYNKTESVSYLGTKIWRRIQSTE